MKLKGRTAFVTGASRNIGRAIALTFAAEGADLILNTRANREELEAVAEECRKHGVRVASVLGDIGDADAVETMVKNGLAVLGAIDVLVCNAAVNPAFGSMSKIGDDAFDKILGANIRSNHWLAQMVLPDMIAKRDGAIIIVSSIGGYRGSTTIGTYCISKAADLQLARNLAVENGPHNIRVNCIAPGLVKTDFARALWDTEEGERRASSGTPLRRLGEPDDIAGAAVFLASRAGAWMTGQSIVVDGGALA